MGGITVRDAAPLRDDVVNFGPRMLKPTHKKAGVTSESNPTMDKALALTSSIQGLREIVGLFAHVLDRNEPDSSRALQGVGAAAVDCGFAALEIFVG